MNFMYLDQVFISKKLKKLNEEESLPLGTIGFAESITVLSTSPSFMLRDTKCQREFEWQKFSISNVITFFIFANGYFLPFQVLLQ